MKYYLEKYDNVFLYQKTGFFTELLKEQYYTPEDFIEFCAKKISKSIRKLDNEKNTEGLIYNKNGIFMCLKTSWRIFLVFNAPQIAMTMLNGTPQLSMGEFMHAAGTAAAGW